MRSEIFEIEKGLDGVLQESLLIRVNKSHVLRFRLSTSKTSDFLKHARFLVETN